MLGHWDMILFQNGVLSALPYVVMVVTAGVASRDVPIQCCREYSH